MTLCAASACGSFGSSPTDATGDGASGSDGSGLAEGSTDAGSCPNPFVLDFNSTVFPPPAPFLVDQFGASMLTRSATGGVGGTGALQVDLDVVGTGGNGPYANLERHFDIAVPAELELSFDYTAPAAADLYASAGCSLTFRPGTDDQPRTDVYTATFNGEGPRLRSDSRPSDAGGAESVELGMPGAAFHHISVHVTLAKDGLTGNARFATETAAETDLPFTLLAPPKSVSLNCGFYADSAPGHYQALIDNIRFAICPTPR